MTTPTQNHLEKDLKAFTYEEDKTKVQLFNKYTKTDGIYSIQNAARALNQYPDLFIDWLKKTYLFYHGSAFLPYKKYREPGLFILKSCIVNNVVRYQTYVTSKGLNYFAKHFSSTNKENEIFSLEL